MTICFILWPFFNLQALVNLPDLGVWTNNGPVPQVYYLAQEPVADCFDALN